MTAEIKTIVSQLNLAGGTWRDDAPNQVAVREPQSADVPGVGKGDLFVLVEVHGAVNNQETVEQQLAQTIRDSYYLARGAVTASLRRALQAANDQLYQHNQKTRTNKQVSASVVAVVMRNEEAFIAQIGSTSLFAVLNDLIRRYPTQSARPGRSSQKAALGGDVLAEPNLHHLYLAPGDTLILADSRLAEQLSLDSVVRAVVAGNAKATIKKLAQTARAKNGSALVLAAVEAEQSALAALKRNAPASIGRFLGGSKTGYQSATLPPTTPGATGADDETEPSPAAGSRSVFGQMAWFGRFTRQTSVPDPDDEPVAAPSPLHPTAYHPPTGAEDEGRDEPYENPTRAREMASVAHDPGFHPESRHATEENSAFSAGRILRWVGAGLLLLLALLGNGLKTILGLVLPGANSDAPRRAGAQVNQQQSTVLSWKLLLNLVIAIPVIVTLIVVISYIQKGRVREAEYQELVTTAQSKFQQAQAVAADPGAALGLMAEAENSLLEAEAIKADQPEIVTLREQMRTAADQITQVERLPDLSQLRQYTDGGTNLRKVVVQGIEVYVLDPGTDRIFHHRLDDSGANLLPDDESLLLTAREQQVENITVAELLGMTWMPTGGNRQTSDLIILNSTGLLEYNPNWGITTSNLASGDLLASPAAVSSYFGNFYILDPQANRLLRYLPTADGYSAAPESYFPDDQTVNLTNAVDFAIDGAIFILFSDGRIGKYQAGVPVEFNVTGLVKPLSNPTSIYTAPDEEIQYVYVADAGNQRIIQLEKDGRFVRQLKPGPETGTTFANLQAIYVDEIGGRLYILDNNSLYAATLPPVGQSGETEAELIAPEAVQPAAEAAPEGVVE